MKKAQLFSFILAMITLMSPALVAYGTGCEAPSGADHNPLEKYKKDPDCDEVSAADHDKRSDTGREQDKSTCKATYAKIKEIVDRYQAKKVNIAQRTQKACSACTQATSATQTAYFKCMAKVENDLAMANKDLANTLKKAKADIEELEQENQEIAEAYMEDKSAIEQAQNSADQKITENLNRSIASKSEAAKAAHAELAKTEERKKETANAVLNNGSLANTNNSQNSSARVVAKNGGRSTLKEYLNIAKTLSEQQLAAAQAASQSKSGISSTAEQHAAAAAEHERMARYYEAKASGMSKMNGDPSKNKIAEMDTSSVDANPKVAQNDLGDSFSESSKSSSQLPANALSSFPSAGGANGKSAASGNGVSLSTEFSSALNTAPGINGASSSLGSNNIVVASEPDHSKALAYSSTGADLVDSLKKSTLKKYNSSGSSSMPGSKTTTSAANGAAGGGSSTNFSQKDIPIRSIASIKASDEITGGMSLSLNAGSEMGITSDDVQSSIQDMMGAASDENTIKMIGSSKEFHAESVEGNGTIQGERAIQGIDSEPLFHRSRATIVRALRRGNLGGNISKLIAH